MSVHVLRVSALPSPAIQYNLFLLTHPHMSALIFTGVPVVILVYASTTVGGAAHILQKLYHWYVKVVVLHQLAQFPDQSLHLAWLL